MAGARGTQAGARVTLEVRIAGRAGDLELDVRFASDAPVTALFGPSGAGKSSVLNAIAGLLTPDRGRIVAESSVFFDAPRVNLPPRARRVGYVFQEGRLLPHFDVRANLLYGRFFRPRAERSRDFEAVVQLLDLGHLLSRRPRNLSGGEKQRVAIGRALLASPRLLLMDEPLASLDAPRKSEILYYIERLRDETGVPIVYVSHSVEEVVRLADTVVRMEAGRVIEAGPVFGRLEGGAVVETRVAGHDLAWGLTRLDFAGGELYAADVDALVGERVRVRIRAQDVSLALSRPAGVSMLNILAATVRSVDGGVGASVDVRLDVSGAEVLARVTRKSVSELGIEPGKRVFALIKSVAIDRLSVGYA
jgi:molybdate transport system ATP-binding protein